MSALLVHAGAETADWCRRFALAAPSTMVRAWSDPLDATQVQFIACWNPPANFFRAYANLRAVFALGAGVERLLARDDLPPSIPVVRLIDAGMAEQMVEYALLGVLTWQRRGFDYRAQQTRARWQQHAPVARNATRVGVLGMGAMGGAIASALTELGYCVCGWSRQPRNVDGVRCLHGLHMLDDLLAETDVLVNTLPSTEQTRGLLDRLRLSRLPKGALVVNAARGDQLDADALLALLDAGHLGGALLDVFQPEPLPAEHALWGHPRVMLTPHVAATTLPDPSVQQIVDNLQRALNGEPMLGVVDRARGY